MLKIALFFGASVPRLPLFGVLTGYACPIIVSSSKTAEIGEVSTGVRNVHCAMRCEGVVEALGKVYNL